MPVTVWHFLCIYSLRPHSTLGGTVTVMLIANQGTEALRGLAACPRLPSQKVVEPALKPRVHALRVQSERLSGGN